MKSHSIDSYLEHLSSSRGRHGEIQVELARFQAEQDEARAKLLHARADAAESKSRARERWQQLKNVSEQLQQEGCIERDYIEAKLHAAQRELDDADARESAVLEALQAAEQGAEWAARRQALNEEHAGLERRAQTLDAWREWLGKLRANLPELQIHVLADQAELEEWFVARAPTCQLMRWVQTSYQGPWALKVQYWPASLAWIDLDEHAQAAVVDERAASLAPCHENSATIKWLVEDCGVPHPSFKRESGQWGATLVHAGKVEPLGGAMHLAKLDDKDRGEFDLCECDPVILVVEGDGELYASDPVWASTETRCALGEGLRLAIRQARARLKQSALAGKLEAQALARLQAALGASFASWGVSEWTRSDSNLHVQVGKVLELFQRLPWSDGLVGNLAVMKHLLEKDGRAQVCWWKTERPRLVGFRVRTKDHDWIVGQIWLADEFPLFDRSRQGVLTVQWAKQLTKARTNQGVVELFEGAGSVALESNSLRVLPGRQF